MLYRGDIMLYYVIVISCYAILCHIMPYHSARQVVPPRGPQRASRTGDPPRPDDSERHALPGADCRKGANGVSTNGN